MIPKRAEPFLVALNALRMRLRDGGVDYERRLAATEIAEQLRLSPTPVREALARLAGEGLVEDRRGQGYFVRRPGAADVADLYRLSQAHLLIALEAPAYAFSKTAEAGDAPAESDGVLERVDAIFDACVAAAGGRALQASYQRNRERLAPVRRREPILLRDLAEEAEDLAAAFASGGRSACATAIRAFHRRRIRLAERLADLLERPRPL